MWLLLLLAQIFINKVFPEAADKVIFASYKYWVVILAVLIGLPVLKCTLSVCGADNAPER